MKRKTIDINIDGTAITGAEFKKALDKVLSEDDCEIKIKPFEPAKPSFVWEILFAARFFLPLFLIIALYIKYR